MNSEHQKHDSVLVARYAAGDAYPSELDDAKRLVSGCDDCSALASDIMLIAAHTSELPDVRRPRDFRISPEQAEQLTGSWLDRVMRRFSTPGFGVARPLAAAALMIGLAFVAVGALPLGNLSTRNSQDSVPAAPQITQTGGTTSFAGGTPAEQPQPPSTTSAPAKNTDGLPPTDKAVDAAATAGAEAGGAPTPLPGMSVATDSVNPPQTAATAPQSQPSMAPAASTEAQPTMATASSAPHATATAPLNSYAGPSAAPTRQAVADVGHANVALNQQSSLDRSWFIIAGLLIAFLALIALGLIAVFRSRYEDPLVR